jgi:hypothetical protein
VLYDPGQRPGLTYYVGMTGLGPESPHVGPEDPRAGFFGYDRVITTTSLQGGTGYTLVAVETAQNLGPWAAGGPATTRWLDPEDPSPVGVGRAFGGLHPGGMNTLRADGSFHFVRDDVRPESLRQLVPLVRAVGPDVLLPD